tara:strand:+ start:775 stop:999 length:225 start_codon:yes stop_codon:yes gene_type:complete
MKYNTNEMGYDIQVLELFDDESSSIPTRYRITAEDDLHWFIQYYDIKKEDYSHSNMSDYIQTFKQWVTKEERKL